MAGPHVSGDFSIRIDGQVLGGYSKQALLEMRGDGRLPGTTLTWQRGESRWRPLSSRWPTRRRALSRHAGVVLSAVVTALACLLPLVYYGVIPGTMALVHEPVLFASLLVATWVVAFALASAHALLVRMRQGHLSLGPVLCLMACAGSAVYAAAGSVEALRLREVLADTGDARIFYVPGQQAIRIEGEIGPRFLQDLQGQLDAHPDARVISMDSPGGLLDEALEAANRVARRNMVLRVDGECASACVAMFAAAPTRQATPRSMFGLHRTRMLAQGPQVAIALSLDASEERVDRLMQDAGFSAELVQRRRDTAPEDVHWIGAVPTVLGGVRAEITDAEGTRLATRMAQLQFVQWHLEGSAEAGAIEALLPFIDDIPAEQVTALYAAVLEDDVEAFFAAHRTMSLAMTRFALALAPDEAIIALMQRRAASLSADEGRPDPAYCHAMQGGDATWGVDETGTTVDQGSADFLADLEALLHSIPPSSRPRVGAAADRLAASDWLERRYRRFAASNGHGNDVGTWNGPQRCALQAELYRAAQALSPGMQVEVTRLVEGLSR